MCHFKEKALKQAAWSGADVITISKKDNLKGFCSPRRISEAPSQLLVPELVIRCSPLLLGQDLLERCMQRDHKQRPDFSTIVREVEILIKSEQTSEDIQSPSCRSPMRPKRLLSMPKSPLPEVASISLYPFKLFRLSSNADWHATQLVLTSAYC